jgi:hypothetical protein
MTLREFLAELGINADEIKTITDEERDLRVMVIDLDGELLIVSGVNFNYTGQRVTIQVEA